MSRGLQIEGPAVTLRGQVEDKLRTAIGLGQFKPGQRLVERELCKVIRVSRTSLREALRRLEAEGLVTMIPFRGPVVRTITAEDARQIYEILTLLQPFGARLFAERGGVPERAQLTVAFRGLKRAAKGDRDQIEPAKIRFHSALAAGCSNETLRQSLGNLHGKIRLLQLPSCIPTGDIVEFEAIHDAIMAGDGTGAEGACLRYVRAAAAATSAFFAEPVLGISVSGETIGEGRRRSRNDEAVA